MDERLRLFCALQLPDRSLDELGVWQAAHLRGRVVPRRNLHVTLAFLGTRPRDELPGIAAELREAAATAGPIELRPVRYRETARVGMLVCEDAGGRAAALAADVQERLERLGVYRREQRPWLPHVTVLRSRTALRSQTAQGLRPPFTNMCSIHVVRSALYRSVLGNDGATYDALETAALGGR